MASIAVGNKNDVKKREVSKKDASEFAEKNNFDYIETSSKEDNNVDQVSLSPLRRGHTVYIV